MSAPTFFLVGAPKAGTTSLFRYLGAHPDVAVSSLKEPGFFAPEVPVDPITESHRRSWDAYCALFAHAGGARAIGEGSVSYLGSINAAPAIHARLPMARILMMLRDPADRLFAHYTAARAADATSADFSTWINVELERERQRSPVYGAVWAGRYATHVERFCQHFPQQQLQISYFEDFVTDPDAVLARIFAFLGVDPSVTVDQRQRHNVTTTPKWPGLTGIRQPVGTLLRRMLPAATYERARSWSRHPMRLSATTTDRARAIALYQPEIESLARLTGRDLSAWLRP